MKACQDFGRAPTAAAARGTRPGAPAACRPRQRRGTSPEGGGARKAE